MFYSFFSRTGFRVSLSLLVSRVHGHEPGPGLFEDDFDARSSLVPRASASRVPCVCALLGVPSAGLPALRPSCLCSSLSLKHMSETKEEENSGTDSRLTACWSCMCTPRRLLLSSAMCVPLILFSMTSAIVVPCVCSR